MKEAMISSKANITKKGSTIVLSKEIRNKVIEKLVRVSSQCCLDLEIIHEARAVLEQTPNKSVFYRCRT